MPEARFNEGGMLPPMSTAGYGNGLDGSADGRFNAGDSLLGNMEPYAYGKGDRLSTQTAYLANPHNIQKIVPQLMLPDSITSSSAQTFMLAHGVSDGDVAFSIRFSSPQVRTQLMHHSASDYFRQGAGRAVDYICNVAVINYLIRGFCTQKEETNGAWEHFACAIDFEAGFKYIQQLVKLEKLILEDLHEPTEHDDEAELDRKDEQFKQFAKMLSPLIGHHRFRDYTADIYRFLLAKKALTQGDTIKPIFKMYRILLRGLRKDIPAAIAETIQQLVRDNFRPLGVVIGSAKQGGQHESKNAAITWPVSYVVTISIDGKNENICNYWRHTSISSGSLLGFKIATRQGNTYTLNNHKYLVKKTFSDIQQGSKTFPQLVPAMMNEPVGKHDDGRMFQNVGFWQFCMSQIMHQGVLKEAPCTSVVPFHNGALLQVTISIVWVRNPFDVSDLEVDVKDTMEYLNQKYARDQHAREEWDSVSGRQVPRPEQEYVAQYQSKRVNFSKPLYATNSQKLDPTVPSKKRDHASTANKTTGNVLFLTDADRAMRGLGCRMKMQKCDISDTVHTTKNTTKNTTNITTTEGASSVQVHAAHEATSLVQTRKATPVVTTSVFTTPMLQAPVVSPPVLNTPAKNTKGTSVTAPASKSRAAKVTTDKAFTSVSEGSFTRL